MVLKSPEVGLPVLFANFCSVADNIEKIDTNDSVADACVRLWVIADFLIFKELKNEAVTILQKHCDEKAKLMCVLHDDGARLFPASKEDDSKFAIQRLFRGVDTAYAQHPHAVPCQKILINFFHGNRAFLFGSSKFHIPMSKAPLQFSHELFMATIGCGTSKSSVEESEFYRPERAGNCTCCNDDVDKHPGPWAVQPPKGGRALKVPWRCIPCFKQHGFDGAQASDERH